MIVIGEKINGTFKKVAQAIIEKDVRFIRDLAQSQIKAGADFLDVNAGGVPPNKESDSLAWLIGVVQDVVDTPICIDSANPKILAENLPLLKRPGILNSISKAAESFENLLPLIKAHECEVIALLMDKKGVPGDVSARMDLAFQIIKSTRESGIKDECIYFDPLVQPIGANPGAGRIFLEMLRLLKQEFPNAKTISGLSNISFGLPARRIVNHAFLALTAAAGMDAAIMDPLDPEMLSVAKAARAVIGLDQYAQDYLSAYRQGLTKSL